MEKINIGICVKNDRFDRAIWNALVVRQSADSCITVACFAGAAYYKYIGQLDANVICCSISFLSNALTLGYNTYLFVSESKLSLETMLEAIQQDPTLKCMVDGKSVFISSAYKRFKMVVFLAYNAMINVAVGSFVLGLWGLLSINTVDGMAWSSPVIGIIHFGLFGFGFSISNYFFIKW